MRFEYYPETDSMYIALSEKKAANSTEIAPNVVADMDEDGNLVGIDIYQDASSVVDLEKFEITSPFIASKAA